MLPQPVGRSEQGQLKEGWTSNDIEVRELCNYVAVVQSQARGSGRQVHGAGNAAVDVTSRALGVVIAEGWVEACLQRTQHHDYVGEG